MNYELTPDYKHLDLTPVAWYRRVSVWKAIIGVSVFIILWGLSGSPYVY